MHILKNNFFSVFRIVLFIPLAFIGFSQGKDTLPMVPKKHPFPYNLGVKVFAGKTKPSEITLCCHGYGHNNTIVDCVEAARVFPRPLIGFNFPDYDITEKSDHHKSKYGSIDEILPLLYLIKYYACDVNIPTINLYGFSAGGGAVINALVVLNNHLYNEHLKKIDVSKEHVKTMISALEHGDIILECPLKSMEEIMALRGKSSEFEILSSRYTKNNLNPIDTVRLLAGLTLNIVVHFQKPDDILSNRDDNLFIERLQKANSGNTTVSLGQGGGHNTYHPNLWNRYR